MQRTPISDTRREYEESHRFESLEARAVTKAILQESAGQRRPTAKKEIAVALCSKVTPRFCNCAAVLHDAIDKHKAAACSQPRKNDNQNEHDNNHKNDARHENWVWNLADRVIYLLYFSPARRLVVKTAAATPQTGQPCGKANDKPFFKIERLKQDSLHQLERFAERLEDLDL